MVVYSCDGLVVNIMRTERKHILIYSSNIYFIKGIRALLTEMFHVDEYVIHVYDAIDILDIMAVGHVSARTFIFTSINNKIFLLYMKDICNGRIIQENCSIDDAICILMSGGRDGGVSKSLSSRERTIVLCMKLGMTDSEIASMLNISKKTVSAHRRNIISKVGAMNRNELYKHIFLLRK